MKVHAFETATLAGNETFLRGNGFGALLRPRRDCTFPVLSFVIEHPDGLVAIDTGFDATPRVPRAQRRLVPVPRPGGRDMATLMREAGLPPEEVRTVVLTHLDWDHAGGLRHFPRAEVLVHRPEYEFAATRMGRLRYQPQLWPDGFRPTLYDAEQERELLPGVRVVPLPGHSIGQVGVVVGDLLFCGDHILNEQWFREDLVAGRELGLGQFFKAQARESTRRLARFEGVLIPSHDPESPARLLAREARSDDPDRRPDRHQLPQAPDGGVRHAHAAV